MADVKLVTYPRASLFVLLASLTIAFGVWRWAVTVLAPANAETVLAGKRPIGNNSDLYPRWLGAREVFLRGADPYSSEITREIQIGFYGRPLNPSDPSDPIAQESFVYPIYVVFLMAPTVSMPFRTVEEIVRWLLLGAIALSVPLWMFAVGFRPHRLIVLSSMLLAGSSYPAVEEYFQQNLAAIVLLFLAAAAASAVHHRLALSGFLLALSTSKPDTTGLIVLWFLLWALAKWKERGRLIWSFAGTLLVLECASEAISPHWISHFLAAVWKYPTYGTDPSVLGALFPRWLALLATAALVLWFLMVCWKWRQSPANSKCFGWAIAWAGVVTLTVIPKLAAYNQLLLIPVLLILVGQMNGSAFLRRMLARAAFACQGWQWLTAVLLATGSFVVPWDRLRTVALIPLYTLLALPLLALLAVIASTCRCPPSATRDLSR